MIPMATTMKRIVFPRYVFPGSGYQEVPDWKEHHEKEEYEKN
jgi:hypothetical protein